jgi:hypothetical protein
MVISAGTTNDLDARNVTSERAVLPKKFDSPFDPMVKVPKCCVSDDLYIHNNGPYQMHR